MTTETLTQISLAKTAAPRKSKRVRTGCLTCRERHLKCDEALPECSNCRKSGRSCKRGIRLNFLNIQVHMPPSNPPVDGWNVDFQDESRQVAAQYSGGLNLYSQLDAYRTPKQEPDGEMVLSRLDSVEPFHFGGTARAGPLRFTGIKQEEGNYRLASYSSASNKLTGQGTARSGVGPPSYFTADETELSSVVEPPSSSRSTTLHVPSQTDYVRSTTHEFTGHSQRPREVSRAVSVAPRLNQSADFPENTRHEPELDLTAPSNDRPASGERDYLGSTEEVHYMQVFVEEVAVWMDSFDKDKHFGDLIPYEALQSPMLLNALLACGVKHTSLTSPGKEEKALFYYNTATTQLLRNLQNPDRNTAECATAAVVLNVYEIMSDRPTHRMNHVAGARALIRECGWNAASTGAGAACFWLNIGMEVLSCLAKNWQATWDPDGWGLDTDMREGRSGREGEGEEVWVHRIFYIVAKIANFKALTPPFQEPMPHNEQARLGNRLGEWQVLKRLCDDWNNGCPRMMHPMGYLSVAQPNSDSSFPRIWLIKRAAILGRLFYHMALCILAQTHPLEPAESSDEMHSLQLHHAQQICGIVAKAQDRSVAPVAIRALAVAAPVLRDARQRAEVLELLARTNILSGWKLGDVEKGIKAAWEKDRGKDVAPFFGFGGVFEAVHESPSQLLEQHQQRQESERGMGSGVQVVAPNSKSEEHGATLPAMNPLTSADFSLPDHPYQNWYEPPNRTTGFGGSFFE